MRADHHQYTQIHFYKELGKIWAYAAIIFPLRREDVILCLVLKSGVGKFCLLIAVRSLPLFRRVAVRNIHLLCHEISLCFKFMITLALCFSISNGHRWGTYFTSKNYARFVSLSMVVIVRVKL
jgi:hypothetical protein